MTNHERFVPVLRRLIDPLNPDSWASVEETHAIEWALGRITAARQRDEATAEAATLRKHAEALAAALSGLLDVIDRLGTVNTPTAVKARETLAAWRSGPGSSLPGQEG